MFGPTQRDVQVQAKIHVSSWPLDIEMQFHGNSAFLASCKPGRSRRDKMLHLKEEVGKLLDRPDISYRCH